MSDINEKSNFVFEFQPVTKLFEEQMCCSFQQGKLYLRTAE